MYESDYESDRRREKFAREQTDDDRSGDRYNRNDNSKKRPQPMRDDFPAKRSRPERSSCSGSPTDHRELENKQQERFWSRRRERRADIGLDGDGNLWGESPTRKEVQETYRLREEVEEIQAENEIKGKALKAARMKAKRKEERKRKNLSDSDLSFASDDSNSELEDSKKKKSKKDKKEKMVKKEKKKKAEMKIEKPAGSSDEWEVGAPEDENGAREGSCSPGPIVPEHVKAKGNINDRIPRRGEIGLSSSEISQYEKWGYVMSGSRHKVMEATRVRKENQILTAEEKRLLSSFSSEARKKKGDAVLDQFRNLVKNKNVGA